MTAAIKALAKAQTEMGKALKNASNPHLKSKYADLGSVMDACFSALHGNGFAVMQPCGRDEHGQYVETILAHESGETFGSRVHLVIGKADMQGVGSAITYARRYGLLGMAGLAPEDDDGEAQKAQPPRREEPPARDPKAIADGLIATFGKATTADSLQAAVSEGTKAAAAWDWLEIEAKPQAARVKAAFDARLTELDTKDQAA
jgi:hypothetical protein